MTLPLARAADRLRGQPGYPGRIGRPRNPGNWAGVAPESGDRLVTAASGDRMNGGPQGSAEARQASAQTPPDALAGAWGRLLTLRDAARYLGVHFDTVRELATSGALRAARVAIPAPTTAKRKGDRINLVLLDRLVLDALVERWREQP